MREQGGRRSTGSRNRHFSLLGERRAIAPRAARPSQRLPHIGQIEARHVVVDAGEFGIALLQVEGARLPLEGFQLYVAGAERPALRLGGGEQPAAEAPAPGRRIDEQDVDGEPVQEDEAAEAADHRPVAVLRVQPDGRRFGVFADEAVVELPQAPAEFAGAHLVHRGPVEFEIGHGVFRRRLDARRRCCRPGLLAGRDFRDRRLAHPHPSRRPLRGPSG